jgi:hypothetical protein
MRSNPMSIEFSEKGKFFTDIVFKESVTATIQTTRCRIHGKVYMHRENRLIDEINHTDQFIAVTDAVIFSDSGDVLYKSDFITINRNHIIWLLPHEETEDPEAGITKVGNQS